MVLPSFSGVRFDDAGALVSAGASASRKQVSELLAKPERTKEGWLRAQGVLTRPGVFEYLLPNGSIRYELRPAEEVFDPDSIASFALVPLTLDHPRKLLNAETARAYSVGTCGRPERLQDVLVADILITDDTAIRAAESGYDQLSCGYTQDNIPISGTYVDPTTGAEQHFDAIQTNIRGNHLALTNNGRAGEDARLRMDSADQRSSTMRIKMGGAEFDVPDALIALLTDEQKASLGIEVVTTDAADPANPDEKKKDEEQRMDSKVIDELNAKIAAQAAKIAAQEGKIAQMDVDRAKERETADKNARMDAASVAVTERIQLIAQASPFIGKTASRPDGKTVEEMTRMDSNAIMAAVVEKESPSIKLEGKPADFIRGIYEHIVSARNDTAAELNVLLGGGRDAQVDPVRMDAAADDPDKARQREIDRKKNAWKSEAVAK